MNLTAALQASTDRRFRSLEKIAHRMRVLCEIVRAEVEQEMQNHG